MAPDEDIWFSPSHESIDAPEGPFEGASSCARIIIRNASDEEVVCRAGEVIGSLTAKKEEEQRI